ncbi:MAG: AMP-binding protein [Firmicutes bacterium]|nr:AMP-binding protein [Bacillota bacterium]
MHNTTPSKSMTDNTETLHDTGKTVYIKTDPELDALWYTDLREIRDIKQMVRESAELYPDRPAFWTKKQKGGQYVPISYRMFKQDVDALGTQMLSMGWKGRKIAVTGQNCYEWYVTFMAVLNGVGVIVPIDKDFNKEAVENILKTAECDIIFHTGAEEKKIDAIGRIRYKIRMDYYGDRVSEEDGWTIPPVSGERVHWREFVREGYKKITEGDATYSQQEIDREALAELLFTSGTTGNPKGVMLNHRNLASNVMDVARMERLTPDVITLSILPIHHTFESTCTMLFLYRGASTAYGEGLKYITKNMNEVHNSWIVGVPLMLEMIYNRMWKAAAESGQSKKLKRALSLNHKSMRIGINLGRILFKKIINQLGGRLVKVVSGAASIPPNIARGFLDMRIEIAPGYGLSECAPLVSAMPSFAPESLRYKKIGSVGICIKSGQIKLENVDEQGIGEIWFKGPNVMMGYYKMPELTAETIVDGWINTGDLGFADDRGFLYITGRSKNVIVTKTGENIYPEEIEAIVLKSAFVKDCMVYAKREKSDDLVAIQILPDEEAFLEQMGEVPDEEAMNVFMKKLIREVNSQLTVNQMIRRVIVRKEDFLRTTTLKIKRHENMNN